MMRKGISEYLMQFNTAFIANVHMPTARQAWVILPLKSAPWFPTSNHCKKSSSPDET